MVASKSQKYVSDCTELISSPLSGEVVLCCRCKYWKAQINLETKISSRKKIIESVCTKCYKKAKEE